MILRHIHDWGKYENPVDPTIVTPKLLALHVQTLARDWPYYRRVELVNDDGTIAFSLPVFGLTAPKSSKSLDSIMELLK